MDTIQFKLFKESQCIHSCHAMLKFISYSEIILKDFKIFQISGMGERMIEMG